MTRLSDQIDNDNEFGLGHWSETDTQYSDARHMMHVPLTTPAPLSIAATAPMDTSGLEYIGATISALAPPPVNPPSNGGSRALSGVPPPIFNGDRDKSELFLDKFMSYEIVNGDSRQFTTPFLKVALCLSYMNGPKIDSWARHRRLWLKAQKDSGVSMMDRSLWDDFEADFCRAYADQDAKLTAYQKLNELRMHGSDIDSYVAEFDRLIDEAGYSRSDISVLKKFKEGLHPSLVREVLPPVVPAPATLAAWKQKARERQTVYKELKNAGLHQKSHGGGPTPTQQKWAQKLGLHNYQTPAQRATNPVFRPQYSPASQSSNWRNQVIPMDVDAGQMDDSRNVRKEPTHNTRYMAKDLGRRGLSPLTEAERAELMAKRACFHCHKPGHMSRDCYSRRGPETVNAGNTATEPLRREAGPQEPAPKKASIESVGGIEGIYDLLK